MDEATNSDARATEPPPDASATALAAELLHAAGDELNSLGRLASLEAQSTVTALLAMLIMALVVVVLGSAAVVLAAVAAALVAVELGTTPALAVAASALLVAVAAGMSLRAIRKSRDYLGFASTRRQLAALLRGEEKG